ncbi:TIGR00725 family protein [Thermoplasmatota archaeon]
MKKLISVIGSDGSDINLSKHALEIAEEIGGLIAKKNAILICGGRGGIMEAACKGAKEKNGITVGIMPESKEEANKFVEIPIISGLGNIRNSLIANTSEAIIAIAGRWGTLNEISYSMIYQKPLILIKGTGGIVDYICNQENNIINNIKNCYIVSSPDEAIEKVFELIEN